MQHNQLINQSINQSINQPSAVSVPHNDDGKFTAFIACRPKHERHTAAAVAAGPAQPAAAAAAAGLLPPAVVGESVVDNLVRLLQFETDESPDVDLVVLAVDLLTDVITEPPAMAAEDGRSSASSKNEGRGRLLKLLCTR
jgi:hypothetical protein